MAYRLHDDVSCCQVDGHWVFLDTRSDRYFRVSSRMEQAFVACINGGGDSADDVNTLVERGILSETYDTSTRCLGVLVDCPARSAVEQGPHVQRVPMATLLYLLAIICLIRLQLATRSLADVLSAVTTYRQRRASKPSVVLTESEATNLSNAAVLFLRARVYVPIEPRCLLDSLAMVRFLAKRGLHARIVFGVTGSPFGAHAWVQAVDLVLSDTVGNVTAHTPIRVL